MKSDYTILLFDTDETHGNLLPLSYTRAVADFRLGITTLKEKWERWIQGCYRYLAVEFLSPIHSNEPDENVCYLFLAGNVIAGQAEAADVMRLSPGQAIVKDGKMLAGCLEYRHFLSGQWEEVVPEARWEHIEYVFDIFLKNSYAIELDYEYITAGRSGCKPGEGVTVLGTGKDDKDSVPLFIEEGASVEGCTINVADGPVYIGKDATVMEGSCLRGPLAVCDHAVVRMGAKVYGSSTFGPYCKVGGETSNVVMFGYSNKAHDGYLGNSVIGEWCNIGAGVNSSNLKNNYAKIRVWNYRKRSFMRTDLQFCGLIMGDHSKAGINTMFNTATVVGVGVNVYGSGFPRVFIPSFSEGSSTAGFNDVSLKQFFEIAERVMSRRSITLDDNYKELFGRVYEAAKEFKNG